MAEKKIYTIEINGIKESTESVNTLIAKLNELQSRVSELSKEGVKLKIGGTNIKESTAEIDESKNTLASMRKELAKLKKELANTEIGTEEFDELRKKTLEANNAVKEIEQSYGVFSRNVGNYTNSFLSAFDKFPKAVKDNILNLKSFNKEAASLQEQMKTVQKSMGELSANGGVDTQEFEALKDVYSDLADAQRDYNDAIDDAKDKSGGLKDVVEVFEATTGAMQLAAGAASLFGKNSDEAVKAIQKMQALQSIANGLKSLQVSLQRNGSLWKLWQASLKGADKVIGVLPAKLKATSVAMNTVNASTKATTVSLKALRVAIAATGIGLLVVAIGTLVGYLTTMGDAVEDAQESLENLGGYIDGSLSDQLAIIEREHKFGEITGVEAAKKKLQEIEKATQSFIGEWGQLKDAIEEGWWDKFVSSLGFGSNFKFDFNTKDADNAMRETERIFSTPAKSSQELDKQIEALRKNIQRLKNDGSDEADAAAEYTQKVLDKLIERRDAIDDVRAAENELAENMRQWNIDAMADGYNKQLKQIEENFRKEKEKYSSNADAIAALEKKKQYEINKLNREWGQKRLEVQNQIAKNELASQKSNLDIRLKQLELERQQEINAAKESGIKVKEQISAINVKFEFLKKEEIDKAEKEFKNFMDNLKKTYNDAVLDISETNIANEIFNFDDSKFNGKFIKFKNNLDELFKMFDGVEVPTDFATIWRNKLVNELGYAADDANVIMANIASSMTERLGKAIDGWVAPDYANEIIKNMNPSEIDSLISELVKSINDNFEKLNSQGKNVGETWAQSIAGSIDLATNGLYDLNMAFPELISSEESYWKQEEEGARRHFDTLRSLQEDYEIKRYNTELEAIKKEFDLQKEELDKKNLNAQQYQNAYNLIETAFLDKEEALNTQHWQEMQRIDSDYRKNTSELTKEHIDKLLSLYDNYFIEIQTNLEQSQRHNMNRWNIVNYSSLKKGLDDALNSYEEFCTRMEEQKDDLDNKLSSGEINFDTYLDEYQKIETKTKEAANTIEDIKERLRMLPGELLQSINTYLTTALNGFSDIMNAVFDKTNAEMDYQIELLEDENDRLSKILDEQADIVEKHNDKISDIEGKLGDARGDRRDQLIDALNAEKIARERAYAEEKRIEKEKEQNEKKQKALEKKQKEEQHKQQVAQAIISAALATANGFATQPFMPVGIAMGALAAALGAAQVAIISNTKYANGGLLNGPAHSQGGIKIPHLNAEVEGGEFVTNKVTTQNNIELLEFINSKKKRISIADLVDFYDAPVSTHSTARTKFANGGQLPVMQGYNLNNSINRIVVDTSDQPIVVSVEEITRVQDNIRNVQTMAGYK